MINHATDIIPKFLTKELLRLGRLDRNWGKWKMDEKLENGEFRYSFDCNYDTWISHLLLSGADGFAMWAASTWLVDGPKIFRPTLEQCEALEQIEVKLELHEYAQPYPAILIDLPENRYGWFNSVLCHRSENMLTCVTHSYDHRHDITTTIAVDGRPIEFSLQRFDKDVFRCLLHENSITTSRPDSEIMKVAKELDLEGAGNQISLATNLAQAIETIHTNKNKEDRWLPRPIPLHEEEAAICGKALRVAVNSCLALVNFGCYHRYLFKEEAKRDQGQLEREQKGGKDASLETRNRVRLAPRIVNFVREVVLHKTQGSGSESTGDSDREMPTHWRRGHWHTVLYGTGKSQRKLKLFPPVLVRADRISDQERVSTVYHT